jgi:serine/threonine-protein kinase RsbW
MRTKSFSGQYESLADIASFVKQAAEEAELSSFDIYAVETAVDEACSNIIEHSYKGEGKGNIHIAVEVTEKGLTIILRDNGLPFDPEKVPQPKINVPLDEREAHGLGLFFMRELMDEVYFDFTTETGNVLTMMKHKEKDTG